MPPARTLAWAWAPVLVLVLVGAVGAAATEGTGRQERRAATPLVFGAAGTTTADRMRFAEADAQWKRPKFLKAESVVPKNESEPLMPPNDQMAANRECPPPPCPSSGTCPHPGGHCCSGAKHCCERGWSCVRTDPPTCVREHSLLVWAECVGRACKAGFKCPYQGVQECCMGGNLCCKRGYRCFGLDDLSMTCAKMSHFEVVEMEKEEVQGKEEKEEEEAKARRDPGAGVPVG